VKINVFQGSEKHKDKNKKTTPPSIVPIVIEDSPTVKGEESPSKTPITYERGSPKAFTWKERVQLQDSKTTLQEAQTVLWETLTKIQETEKL